MNSYELQVAEELKHWQAAMLARPGLLNQAAQRVQRKINSYIPDKVHAALTTVIKQMIQGVLSGSQYTGLTPLRDANLFERESQIRKRMETYRRTAAAEGGITGAGGIMLGLADFPLLLAIKLKMLFDISALYGYAADDYRQRLFILGIFQLAFSSDAHRRDVYLQLADWDARLQTLPASIDQYDWHTLQQQYRDYIDLAKLAQLLPIVGAPVGYLVNRRLIDKLGMTAMNAYRMRWPRFAAGDEVTT